MTEEEPTELEVKLREVLNERSSEIRPSDRLDRILRQVHAQAAADRRAAR